MFGLMKNTAPSPCATQSDWYRLHYCGTCKALGQMYGQRSRVFLNYDIVFLAEFLHLIQEEDTRKWGAHLQSYDCFALPRKEELPLVLAFAADVNVLFVDLKIRDNIEDNSSSLWNLATSILQKPLGRLPSRMSNWNIDQEALFRLQAKDIERERAAQNWMVPQGALAWHAEPSAQITAYFFSKGAKVINRPELAEKFHQVGYAYGELIYALDALEDREKDREAGEFNPLLLLPQLSDEQAANACQEWIWEKVSAISQLMESTPLAPSVKETIAGRLQLNLSMALSEAPKVCRPKSGVEQGSVPRFFRKANQLKEQVGAWLNPLQVGRFTLTYLVFLFTFFHHQLLAVGSELSQTKNLFDNTLLLALLLGIPPLAFFVGKKVVKNKERWKKKLERKRKRWLKRLRKAEKKAKDKGKKRKWWFWVLVILGGILVLGLLSALLSSGGGGGCSGGGCGGCGDCDCECNC